MKVPDCPRLSNRDSAPLRCSIQADRQALPRGSYAERPVQASRQQERGGRPIVPVTRHASLIHHTRVQRSNGEVVGRMYRANAAPVGSPWMWTLAFWHHKGRSQRTAMPQLGKRQWRPSPKAGGGSDAPGTRGVCFLSGALNPIAPSTFTTRVPGTPPYLDSGRGSCFRPRRQCL